MDTTPRMAAQNAHFFAMQMDWAKLTNAELELYLQRGDVLAIYEKHRREHLT